MARVPRHTWQQWQLDMLQQTYADTLTVDLARALGLTVDQVQRKANQMGVRKSIAIIAATAAERSSRPDHGGRRTAFRAGSAPWNKGKPGATGTQPGCRLTQFKSGCRSHTWVPVGSYRVTPDGTLEQKIADLPGPPARRWKPVARLVWEAAHGPLAEGMSVVFKPGLRTTDPAELTVDRLECLTRQQLMQRNTVNRYPIEIVRTVQAIAALKRHINWKLKKESKNEHPDD